MEHNNITTEHNMQLKNQLRELGLPYKLHELLDYHQQMDIREFTIPHFIQEDGSWTVIELNYKPDAQNLSSLDSIDISYRPPIEIDGAIVGDINTKELDEKMGAIDWTYDHFNERIVDEDMKTENGRKSLDHISKILYQLDQLRDHKLQGDKKTAELLMYKHWTHGYYQRFTAEFHELKKHHENTCHVKIEGQHISVPDIVERLKGLSADSLRTKLPAEHQAHETMTKQRTRKRGQSL